MLVLTIIPCMILWMNVNGSGEKRNRMTGASYGRGSVRASLGRRQRSAFDDERERTNCLEDIPALYSDNVVL